MADGNLAFTRVWNGFFNLVDSEDCQQKRLGLESLINTINLATNVKEIIGDDGLSKLVHKLLFLSEHDNEKVFRGSLEAISRLSLSIRPSLQNDYHKVLIPFLSLYLVVNPEPLEEEAKNYLSSYHTKRFCVIAAILCILDREPCAHLNEYIITLAEEIHEYLQFCKVNTQLSTMNVVRMAESIQKPLSSGSISEQIWLSAKALFTTDVRPYVRKI